MFTENIDTFYYSHFLVKVNEKIPKQTKSKFYKRGIKNLTMKE